jgi:hypothetical protein
MALLGHYRADEFNSLETTLALMKQMESTLLGLKQLRRYVGKGPGQQMLESIVKEGETRLAEIKRKLIQ